MAWSVTVWLSVGAAALLLSGVAIAVQPRVVENAVDGRQFLFKLAAAALALYLWLLFSINAGYVESYPNGVTIEHDYGSVGLLALGAGVIVLLEVITTLLSYMNMDKRELKF